MCQRREEEINRAGRLLRQSGVVFLSFFLLLIILHSKAVVYQMQGGVFFMLHMHIQALLFIKYRLVAWHHL